MKRQRGGGSRSNEFQEIAPPEGHSVMVWRPAAAARLLTFRMLLCVHKIEAKRLRFIAELWYPAPLCQGFGIITESGRAGTKLNSYRTFSLTGPFTSMALANPNRAKKRSPGFQVALG
jgi:hypothetical protein